MISMLDVSNEAFNSGNICMYCDPKVLVCQQLSDRNRRFLRIFQSVLTIKFLHRHFQKGLLKEHLKIIRKIREI